MTISEAFGFETVITLAEARPDQAQDQKSIKITPSEERINPEALEEAYLKHSITFNSINKLTQTIMSSGWALQGGSKRALKFYQDFIESVGDQGDPITFDEILESVFKNQMIYGKSYLETVLAKNSEDPNDIVDLVVLDPKNIDYARYSDGRIILDRFGSPIGYVQKLCYEAGIDTESYGDIPPEELDVANYEQGIFLFSKRICMFKLYPYGNRLESIGLIEPGYKSIMYELMVKKAQANSIDQRGEQPVIDYVGDQFHQPTPAQIQSATDTMRNFKYNRYFAFPYWHRIEALDVKPTDHVITTLTYLREDIGASLGMPMSFATGSGQATNRSTLANQHQFLTFTLNDIVSKTVASFNKHVFKRLAESNGFSDDEIPKIVWGHIGIEEINQKAERLMGYVKAGMLDPNDISLQKYIIKSERLEEHGITVTEREGTSE